MSLTEALELNKPFLENKYSKWYIKLVSKESDDEYTEIHHNLPRSLFPEYEKCEWNLVKLSARQHFISHMFLFQMFEKNSEQYTKMLSAINIMKGRTKYFNSRLYEIARNKWSETQKLRRWSEEHKEKISKSMTGTKRGPMSEEHKARMIATKKAKGDGKGKWMHKNGVQKKIKLEQVNEFVSLGWQFGTSRKHITEDFKQKMKQRTNDYWKKVKDSGHTGRLTVLDGVTP